MTPPVAIALITKLKLIFETDANGNKQPDKFLAFQNGSFPVSKENFYFIEPDKYKLGPIDTALKMVDFSKCFNFITSVDDFISPVSDELEDVYHQTLKTAIAANSTRTQDEEQRYNAAKDFLYQPMQTPDGQTVTCLANYDSYDSQYKEALTEYKSREVTALNAQGEDAAEIKATWQNDKDNLKNAIARTLLNWETLGQRSQVEKYLGDFLSLASGSPSKTIADLKMEYELFTQAHSVDHLANELHYTPTYFTPINFFEENISWQSMSLDRSEVNTLVQQAPQRLKDLFNIDTRQVDINKVSFEYIVVTIVREWLHYKDFLLQRFWKLPTDAASLSDGAGNGKLPAFPEKMIFVRNMKIETPKGLPTTASKFHLTTQLFKNLKPQVNINLQKNIKVIDHRRVKADTIKRLMVKDTTFFTPKVLMHTSAKPSVVKMPMAATFLKPALIEKKPAAQPKMVMKPLFLKAQYLPIKPIMAKPLLYGIKQAPGVSHTADPGITVTEKKEMELLAFICSKVPPCPSPDLNLNWS